MFENIENIIEFLWGTPLTIFIVLIGIYLSYCCNFIQLIVIGIITIILSIVIINKGFDKTSNLLKKIVPIMVIIYLVSAIAIIII